MPCFGLSYSLLGLFLCCFAAFAFCLACRGYLFVTLRLAAKKMAYLQLILISVSHLPRSSIIVIIFLFFSFFFTLTLPKEEEQTRFGHSQFPEFVYQFIVCLLFLALRDFTLSV